MKLDLSRKHFFRVKIQQFRKERERERERERISDKIFEAVISCSMTENQMMQIFLKLR